MEKVHIRYSAVFSNNEPRVGVKEVDNDLLAMHLLVATVAVPSMRKEICVFSTPDDQKKRKISTFPSHLLLFSCPSSILQVASTRRTWSASPSRPHPAFGTRLRPGLFPWQQLSLFAQVSEGDGGAGPVRPTGKKKTSFKIPVKIL